MRTAKCTFLGPKLFKLPSKPFSFLLRPLLILLPLLVHFSPPSSYSLHAGRARECFRVSVDRGRSVPRYCAVYFIAGIRLVGNIRPREAAYFILPPFYPLSFSYVSPKRLSCLSSFLNHGFVIFFNFDVLLSCIINI